MGHCVEAQIASEVITVCIHQNKHVQRAHTCTVYIPFYLMMCLTSSASSRFAEFLRSGSHTTKEELQNHENQYGVGGAYYENALFNSSSSDTQSFRGEADDDSEDELDRNGPPILNNIPSPAVYTPAVCPYPPVAYTPQPEPMDPEDQDFF